MSREIKFRGQYSSNHEWAYGDYFNNHDTGVNQDLIISHDPSTGTGSQAIIQRYTLGQYTGFKDCKGKEIYEGDIISDWTEVDEGLIQSFCEVFFCSKSGMWRIDQSSKLDKSFSEPLASELRDFKYEVTGNIHQRR